MSTVIMDGKALASKIKHEIHQRIDAICCADSNKIRPYLVVFQVGDDPASDVYIRGKRKDCEECGIYFQHCHLNSKISESDLIDLIRDAGEDHKVSGILVQLPLPKHIDVHKVMEAIPPEKDVDGFTPHNAGLLMQGSDILTPCTPFGIMKLLEEYKIGVKGKRAVIVGRSNIVGKPMAVKLINAGATVTSCNSHTDFLMSHTKQADILISATGVPSIITHNHVKPGAVVIDVGMNRGPEGKLRGDVDFAPVVEYAKPSFITPVPGGVGVMTRAALMINTYKAWRFWA